MKFVTKCLLICTLWHFASYDGWIQRGDQNALMRQYTLRPIAAYLRLWWWFCVCLFQLSDLELSRLSWDDIIPNAWPSPSSPSPSPKEDPRQLVGLAHQTQDCHCDVTVVRSNPCTVSSASLLDISTDPRQKTVSITSWHAAWLAR